MRPRLLAAAAFAFPLLAAVPAGTSTTVALPAAVPAVAATHVALAPILGASGKLRALIGLPAALDADTATGALVAGRQIDEPGVHPLGLAAPDGDSLVIVSMRAFPARRTARTDGYYTGRWPTSLAARNPKYAPPAGYIAVTAENASTPVSKHFRLADFLTHDQQDVWPKVLVLKPALVDKLELISDALAARGLPSRLHVMSGFRSPQYNEQGVGPRKGGRAAESRHMFGDAADVFVDADGDGRMDDLDHDGRVTVKDARVLLAVAESVEAAHPELVGGLSAYPATAAHGPFVHVDTRGWRARW